MCSKEAERTAEQRLYQMYGLTVNDFLALWDKSEGQCDICGVDMHSRWVDNGDGDRSTRCNVDHCHETGEVRGLLCTQCNTALGKLNDDVDRLRCAISYLQKPAVGFGNPEKETLKQRQLREVDNAMRLMGYHADEHGRHSKKKYRPRGGDTLEQQIERAETGIRAAQLRARIAKANKDFRPTYARSH